MKNYQKTVILNTIIYLINRGEIFSRNFLNVNVYIKEIKYTIVNSHALNIIKILKSTFYMISLSLLSFIASNKVNKFIS